MKVYQISAQKRQETGKTRMNKIRRQGIIPAVIYTAEGPVHIQADEKALNKITHTPETYIVEIEVEGDQTYRTILREAQYHPVFDNLMHMDFKQVKAGETVTVELPLTLTGKAPGVEAGGRLVQKARRIRVHGELDQLPEKVEVSVAKLRLGRSIKMGDLSFEGFKVYNKPDVAVASVEVTRALRQEAAATAGTGAAPAAAPAAK